MSWFPPLWSSERSWGTHGGPCRIPAALTRRCEIAHVRNRPCRILDLILLGREFKLLGVVPNSAKHDASCFVMFRSVWGM